MERGDLNTWQKLRQTVNLIPTDESKPRWKLHWQNFEKTCEDSCRFNWGKPARKFSNCSKGFSLKFWSLLQKNHTLEKPLLWSDASSIVSRSFWAWRFVCAAFLFLFASSVPSTLFIHFFEFSSLSPLFVFSRFPRLFMSRFFFSSLRVGTWLACTTVYPLDLVKTRFVCLLVFCEPCRFTSRFPWFCLVVPLVMVALRLFLLLSFVSLFRLQLQDNLHAEDKKYSGVIDCLYQVARYHSRRRLWRDLFVFIFLFHCSFSLVCFFFFSSPCSSSSCLLAGKVMELVSFLVSFFFLFTPVEFLHSLFFPYSDSLSIERLLVSSFLSFRFAPPALFRSASICVSVLFLSALPRFSFLCAGPCVRHLHR